MLESYVGFMVETRRKCRPHSDLRKKTNITETGAWMLMFWSFWFHLFLSFVGPDTPALEARDSA
jgi:hypothetical protein